MRLSRRLILIGGLAAALLAARPGAAQQAVPDPSVLGFSPERLERITDTFQGYVDKGTMPGAIVLVQRNGQTAYFRTFGHRDKARNLQMTPDAIFRIASMTKPIASVAAMMLVEEGKLDIGAPIATYLPEFKDLRVYGEKIDPATGRKEFDPRPLTRPMTVQDLLRHTAGLTYAPPLGVGPVPEMYREAGVSSRDESLAVMVTKLSKLPLTNQPGDVWEYSVATDIVGRVVEVVSGMELDRFIAERITKPLGMNSTGFWVEEADRDRVAQPQADPVTGRPPALFDPMKKPVRISGGGGAVSTAADYLRFTEMLLNGGRLGDTRLLAPSTVALMTANALKPDSGYSARVPLIGDSAPTPAMGQGFSLGFAVRTEVGRNPLPGSVGSYYWSGAYGTTFYIDPRERLIIILMTQTGLGGNGPMYRRAVRNLTYAALTGAR